MDESVMDSKPLKGKWNYMTLKKGYTMIGSDPYHSAQIKTMCKLKDLVMTLMSFDVKALGEGEAWVILEDGVIFSVDHPVMVNANKASKCLDLDVAPLMWRSTAFAVTSHMFGRESYRIFGCMLEGLNQRLELSLLIQQGYCEHLVKMYSEVILKEIPWNMKIAIYESSTPPRIIRNYLEKQSKDTEQGSEMCQT